MGGRRDPPKAIKMIKFNDVLDSELLNHAEERILPYLLQSRHASLRTKKGRSVLLLHRRQFHYLIAVKFKIRGKSRRLKIIRELHERGICRNGSRGIEFFINGEKSHA